MKLAKTVLLKSWRSLMERRRRISTFCVIFMLLAWFIAFFNLNREETCSHVKYVSRLSPVNLDIPADDEIGPNDWTDQWYCNVNCKSGTPCTYKDEVDFRIIVMTYQRKHSLEKCLNSIMKLNNLGDKVSVEIWIDRSKQGIVDHDSLLIAQKFSSDFKTQSKGRACVHIHSKNSYISGQWINTWRPKPNTKEIALILEDDIDISPLSYKWLKAVHGYFYDDDNIAGYTLQMEETHFFSPVVRYQDMKELKADESQTIFLYPVIGTWGYSPHPKAWRKFQDWNYKVRPNQDINTDYITPYVPGTVPNMWYSGMKGVEKESMWEMWHIKFTHDYQLFTVYSNMKNYLQTEKNTYLSVNRKEKGLHFSGDNEIVTKDENLLHTWNNDFVNFPLKSDLVRFNYMDEPCNEFCCFATSCDTLVQKMMKKSSADIIRLMIPNLRNNC